MVEETGWRGKMTTTWRKIKANWEKGMIGAT